MKKQTAEQRHLSDRALTGVRLSPRIYIYMKVINMANTFRREILMPGLSSDTIYIWLKETFGLCCTLWDDIQTWTPGTKALFLNLDSVLGFCISHLSVNILLVCSVSYKFFDTELWHRICMIQWSLFKFTVSPIHFSHVQLLWIEKKIMFWKHYFSHQILLNWELIFKV